MGEEEEGWSFFFPLALLSFRRSSSMSMPMLYTALKVFKLCWYFKCLEFFPWRFLINILTDSFSIGALTILAEVSFHLLKKEVNPSFSFCFNISSCLWSVSFWMLHLYLSTKAFTINSQVEVFSLSRE